jgi:hypothetical protein
MGGMSFSGWRLGRGLDDMFVKRREKACPHGSRSKADLYFL